MSDKQKPEVNPIFGEVLIKNAMDILSEGLGTDCPEETKLRKLAERLVIQQTVREMCNEHQTSKVVIHIGPDGNVIPEIHLKGQAAVNYLMKDKK